MSEIRRVLQLLHEARLSQREAARAAGVSKTGVGEIASCARAAGMTWAQARKIARVDRPKRHSALASWARRVL